MLYFSGAFSLIDQGEDMIDYARPYGVAAAALSLFGVLLSITFGNANAAETQVQRGKYLVSVEPRTDCHTPG